MQLHTLAMLCATPRIPRSVLTFSNPLNINHRNPQFCFNLPNTASTSTGLLDRHLCPSSDSNLSLAAWRYCSSFAPLGVSLIFQALIDLFHHFIQLFTVNFFPFIPWSPYSSSSSASNSSVCSNKAFTFSCNLLLCVRVLLLHTKLYLFAFASIFVPSTK